MQKSESSRRATTKIIIQKKANKDQEQKKHWKSSLLALNGPFPTSLSIFAHFNQRFNSETN